jgi:hypothetical protein
MVGCKGIKGEGEAGEGGEEERQEEALVIERDGGREAEGVRERKLKDIWSRGST